MSKVRGLVVQSRIEYLENKYDRIVLNTVLGELSDTDRQAIGEQVFPTNLYSFERLKELDNAIVSCLEKTAEEIFKDIGAFHAKKIVYRYFFNYSENQQPQKFLAQIGRLYDQLWHLGKFHYEKIEDTSAKLIFDFDEDVYEYYLLFLKSFLATSIELCGGKSASISIDCQATETLESCEFIIQW